MTQAGRRRWLIEALLEERLDGRDVAVPADEAGQRRLLRALFNLRPPKEAPEVFLRVQDAYLREETARKGVTDFETLEAAGEGLYLWQGDITTLRVDAIVNAANAQMLGCFYPCHGCIDNAIHTYAGVQLRLACAGLMRAQGHAEPTGGAKITPAFNLPSRYVLHTVGPIVEGAPTRRHEEQLASCYRACLALAGAHGLGSVAFCCVSTGEFHFPNQLAAEVAVRTVRECLSRSKKGMKVIFVVYKDIDRRIYERLLRA